MAGARARSAGLPSVRSVADVLALPALAVLLAAVSPLRAQETVIEAQVEQIAGSDIYVHAGTDQGVRAGTVLAVLGPEGADEAGRLRVVESTSSRSVTTFVGAPFPLTRGATLRLRIVSGDEPAIGLDAGGAAGVAAAAGAETPAAGGRASGSSSRSSGPRVSGSLGLSFDARQTTTSWDEYDLEQTERTFSTPTLALRFAVTRLPGGLDFRTNLRAAYRGSTDDIVQPQDLVRVYSLELRKDFGMVQAALGRLYNPYEPMSGYFDGGYVHVGRRNGFGGGVAVGLRPSREDSGISDSIPKYSVFVNYSDRNGPLLYDIAVSYTMEAPDSELLSDHSYVGLTQTVRTGPVRVWQSLTVDRDVTTDKWTVGRFLLGAAVPVTGGLSLNARYSLRQPYRVEQVVPVTYRRGRGTVGLTYNFGGPMIGADVTTNDVTDLLTGDESVPVNDPGMAWTYSGWFSVPETSLWKLGFTGTASYRDLDGNTALYIVPGLTRRFGPTFARLTYTYYRTEEPKAAFTTHSGDLAVDFPIARRLRGTLAGRVQQGAQLDATSIYASLWWAF